MYYYTYYIMHCNVYMLNTNLQFVIIAIKGGCTIYALRVSHGQEYNPSLPQRIYRYFKMIQILEADYLYLVYI